MYTVGILCEKPSAMRHFAEALGGRSGIFEGTKYILTAARGHLYEMAQPEDQVPPARKTFYKTWSMENLPWDEKEFQWRRVMRSQAVDLIKEIEKTLKECDEIAIATDYDPTGEGDLLAWEIIESIYNDKRVTRMVFLDEMPASIQQAFRERKSIPDYNEDEMYRKAEFRQRWDYLSMQFTRVACECAGRVCVPRQGRLKSPMVWLVGSQLKAIEEYKKIPYYQIRFRDENGNVYMYEEEPMHPKKEDVRMIYSRSPVVIDRIQDKRTPPPKLYDLAGLSGALAKKYTASSLLTVYQQMYEKNLVSYPRTEDKTITREQFAELEANIDRIADLAGIDKSLLTVRQPRKTHVKDEGAHGANRIGPNIPSSLDSLDMEYGRGAKDIWLMLAKSCCQMFMEDYEYKQQTGHLEMYPHFKGKANLPVKAGWKAVMSEDQKDEEDEENAQAKELGSMAVPFIHEGFPKKPEAPTVKWLMKKLENHDVGTGSTRTGIFAEICDERHKYPLLKESRGKITLTSSGEISFRLLEGTHIGSLKTTEILQDQMRKVGKGELDMKTCLADMQRLVAEDMERMEANGRPYMDQAEERKKRISGIWRGTEVSIKPVWNGHTWTDEELRRLFNDEEVEVHGLVSKTGKKYAVAGKLVTKIFKGKTYVGFESLRFLDGGFPESWMSHVFTPDEKEALLRGEKIYLENVTNNKGKKFSCELEYVLNEEKGRKFLHPIFPERKSGVPDSWAGHTFTENEKMMLEAGEKVMLYDCVNKAGSSFSCGVEYKYDNSSFKKIVPDFNKKVSDNEDKMVRKSFHGKGTGKRRRGC